MSDPQLIYNVDAGVATIRMNRPAQLNALSLELLAALKQAFDAAADDAAVRAVILTGAGRGFCSGADLAQSVDRAPKGADGKLDIGGPLDTHYNPLVERMQTLPKPIIAAVNGIAAGAGCSLALMADMTIAARSAKFLQAFVNIGLMPDAGGTWILPRLLGPQRAAGFAMLGQPITAEQALAWGLIWEVVDDSALETTAVALATRLAEGPAVALERIKRSLQAATRNDLRTQLQLEREWQRDLGQTGDFIEGVTAFMQKRPARFKGQ
ncbi:MAG TPA: enoyl-CoA hydratase-related protein [Solimonas sp.]